MKSTKENTELNHARKKTLALIKNDVDQMKIYEKIHENQEIFIELQDKRLAMIEKAKESVFCSTLW